MGFNLKYDRKHCDRVIDLGATGNPLHEEVERALHEFYVAVNRYLAKGVSNYNRGYYFNFSFEIIANDVRDDDPDAEAMMQFTYREKGPQDIHLHICGGKNSKYVTSELIIPAYEYLLSKCSLLGFTVHESSYRLYGAPVLCVPEGGNAKDIGMPAIIQDPKYMVTDVMAPKLNDVVKYVPPKSEGSDDISQGQVSKTSVFCN